MKGRRSIVIIENFYTNPGLIREYALHQAYYLPYEDEELVSDGQQSPTWWSSWYRSPGLCPFKSSTALIARLEEAVEERIDMPSWNAHFPVDNKSKPIPKHPNPQHACLWNCSFHVKPDFGQKLGDGVHNHVTDVWNAVGANGWAGILYLNPHAPREGGLRLWTNVNPRQQFDWMSPAKDWNLLDTFANICNRLILCRADMPHSGSNGWNNDIATGRMFQTFFFRTKECRSVSLHMTRAELKI